MIETERAAAEARRLRLERHASMRSSGRVIEDAVGPATDRPLACATRITTGFSNEVYDAATVDGRRVIVRIHHPFVSDAPYFVEERWALERCAAAGVPVPRILILEQVVDPESGRRLSVCVETRLEGAPLSDLLEAGAIAWSDAGVLLAEVGAAVARIHAIPTVGFGPVDASGVGASATYDPLPFPLAHLLEAAERERLGPHVRERVREAYALLERHVPLWDALAARGAVPRLLHGDLDPAHIVVDGGRLSGLIDFEFPAGGDPAEEIAGWDRAHGHEADTKALLAGYRSVATPDDTFAVRVALHRLRIGFAQLGRRNPPPTLMRALPAALDRDLRLLHDALAASATAVGSDGRACA